MDVALTFVIDGFSGPMDREDRLMPVERVLTLLSRNCAHFDRVAIVVYGSGCAGCTAADLACFYL